MTTSQLIEYRDILEILILCMAGVALTLCADDVFIDLYYWYLRITGQTPRQDHGLPKPPELAEVPQRPLAIMVPAWQESEVIYSMLSSNLRLVRYGRAHYFVGVYENDPLTLHEVRRAQALSPDIHAVIVPRPGPTSKADCLNEIVAAATAFEATQAAPFAGFIMHDAEDLIHPLELQVFNAGLAQYDFIQLPVYSFTRRLSEFVASTYMDEFAETHGKDLPVREHISGFIPCAGVSACFSRKAIDRMTHSETGAVFKAGALTEDYDAAFRLAGLGLRPAFIAWIAPYFMDTPRGRGAPQLIREPAVVATREHFPSGFRAAFRQRARWILGIALVGADELGWRGSAGTRFFLARDRKGLAAIPCVMFGYVLFFSYIGVRLGLHFKAPYVPGSELMESGMALALITLSLLLALWRMGHRMYFTGRLYGWRHGLVAAPRMVVSNFVNFFAVCRAVKQYGVHRLTGKALAWDKTAHTYPDSLPSQLPSLFKPNMRPGQTLEEAAQEELERAMASRPRRPPGA